MKAIRLTQGYIAVIDDADYDIVSRYKWHADVKRNNGKISTVYAKTRYTVNGRCVSLYMHRLIMGDDPGSKTDHIDGNGANNTRENLRKCTQSQNGMNRGPTTGTVSKYKGVSFEKRSGKWSSRITCRGKKYSLGHFDTEIDAAFAYDNAAMIMHGKFAWLNFPNGDIHEHAK